MVPNFNALVNNTTKHHNKTSGRESVIPLSQIHPSCGKRIAFSVRDQLSNGFHTYYHKSHNECHNDAKFSTHDSTVFGLLVAKIWPTDSSLLLCDE